MSKWTKITPRNTAAALFHVVLRQFRRFWASLLAQKNRVQVSILFLSAKVLDQIKRERSHFVANKLFLFVLLGGLCNQEGKKIIFCQICKKLIFWVILADSKSVTTK